VPILGSTMPLRANIARGLETVVGSRPRGFESSIRKGVAA
jgi:hypothetical protein